MQTKYKCEWKMTNRVAQAAELLCFMHLIPDTPGTIMIDSECFAMFSAAI